ncbi:hypothetical protein Syun_001752 [Stephania yunnanensis]|uniref:Uncharacterized protein n=1 Tax=Stephania yunnanensis TaxID=152371 RepID=A0AAP0Q6K9_9MAGN
MEAEVGSGDDQISDEAIAVGGADGGSRTRATTGREEQWRRCSIGEAAAPRCGSGGATPVAARRDGSVAATAAPASDSDGDGGIGAASTSAQ